MPTFPRRPSLLRPLLTALTLLVGSGLGAATERAPLRTLTLPGTTASDEARVIVKFRAPPGWRRPWRPRPAAPPPTSRRRGAPRRWASASA